MDTTGCAAPVVSGLQSRVAHVVLSNPFKNTAGTTTGAGRYDTINVDENQGNGPAPAKDMVRLHIWAVGQLRTKLLTGVLVMVPTDARRRTHEHYTDVFRVSGQLPCPVRVVRVSNNTLGSYGMALHAFAITRGEFDHYICTEVDYIPVRAHYDVLLVDMYRRSFGDEPGVLMGLLQGRPAEPNSHLSLHGEGHFVASAATLDHIFDHLFRIVGWRNSTADRMQFLCLRTQVQQDGSRGSLGKFGRHRYDHIQEGFGMLIMESGVRMRDSTSVYRLPYWESHAAGGLQLRLFSAGLHDHIGWTAGGLYKKINMPANTPVPAMHRVIIAPTPWLYMSQVYRCCGLGVQSCHRHPGPRARTHSPCNVSDWRTDRDCCRPLEPRQATNVFRANERLCADVQKRVVANSSLITYKYFAPLVTISLQASNCSHLADIFRPLPSKPYEDAPGASCVLTEPPRWAPAFLDFRQTRNIHGATEQSREAS